MAEDVVYQDSPLAEYLQDIDNDASIGVPAVAADDETSTASPVIERACRWVALQLHRLRVWQETHSMQRRRLYSSQAQLCRTIQLCQQFDLKCTRALKLIQEIELVSRGYRLTTPLPPITRIEQGQPHRQCRHIRQALSHILAQQFTQWTSIYTALSEPIVQHLHCHASEWQDKFAPWLKTAAVVSAEGNGGNDEAYDLQYLRNGLAGLYVYRQLYLKLLFNMCQCSLDPSQTSVPSLAAICQVLECTATLIHALSFAIDHVQAALDHDIGSTIDESAEAVSLSAANGTSSEALYLRDLSQFNHTLRGMQAKVYLIHQLWTSTDWAAPDTADQARVYHQALKQDIESLSNQWESGHFQLTRALSQTSQATHTMPLPSPLDEGIAEASPECGSDSDTVTYHYDTTLTLDSGGPEQVFEAEPEASNPTNANKPKLSRSERIRLQREKREQEVLVQMAKQERYTLMSELKGVLESRKP
ncbi:hypothetical protein H4R35_002094 [Dimargaris xerosporica]|nr:hypothetical protein H4R35_002094 [Dimargaris xerosporica]